MMNLCKGNPSSIVKCNHQKVYIIGDYNHQKVYIYGDYDQKDLV